MTFGHCMFFARKVFLRLIQTNTLAYFSRAPVAETKKFYNIAIWSFKMFYSNVIYRS